MPPLFLRFCAAIIAGAIIGLWIHPANALGFPIPQPKGCVTFWDSAKALRIAQHHPFSTGRYLSDSNFVLFGVRDGGGVMLRHSDSCCLISLSIAPRMALRLLADQESA